MVSYPQTDMKIPVRPAPAPPTNRPNRLFQRSWSTTDNWDDGKFQQFPNGNISRSHSTQHIGSSQTEKKKPPPRPPPPKLNHQHQSRQTKPHTNVLSGLFSRHHSKTPTANSLPQKQSATREVVTASLIDFDSPSSSPTFTTQSSSDGVSVNSLGSDGWASNNGNTPSFGNASLFESGFEDDFDFFGGLSSSSIKTPVSEKNDPWSVEPDQFSPPRNQKLQSQPVSSGQATWFDDSTSNQVSSKPAVASVLKPPLITSSVPTIIRARPSRPTALPKPLQPPKQYAGFTNPPPAYKSLASSEDTARERSPPMPSVPPPPPPENISEVDFAFDTLPDLPPRKPSMKNKQMPYGIAQYDYSSAHPDDLSFKINDKIILVKKITDEWWYGQIGNRQGMFPANFIEVITPPSDQECKPAPSERIVTALYPFFAQQWDDLDFPEGAIIKVLSQINADWLYGECEGREGQFPASFVDHIPVGLPQRKI